MNQGNIVTAAARDYASHEALTVFLPPQGTGISMRRIGCMLVISVAMLASARFTAAQSDSLGDYARAARKEKHPAAKLVYTNDNLPTNTTISVVGPSPASEEKLAEENPAAKSSEEKPAPKEAKVIKPSEAPAPHNEQGSQDQIAAQKKTVADLAHELDLLQREFKLQVANYYADAGNELRDQKNWLDQEAKFKSDIADKQKQLDDAKAQLQEMEEQARKAATSGSLVE